MFPDIKSARKAIEISKRYALLCQAQDKPTNTDFTTHAKFIKVVPLVMKGGAA
jgi:hypothetical protein